MTSYTSQADTAENPSAMIHRALDSVVQALSGATRLRILCVGLALLALASSAGPASAQPDANPDSPVKVRALAQADSVAQGGRLVVAVVLELGEKYHAWPEKGVKLPASVDEFAIRTSITLDQDDKGKPKLPTWIAALDGIQWPDAKKGKVADPTGEHPTIEVPLYSHSAVAFVRLNVSPGAALGEQSLDLHVTFQACDEHVCLIPAEMTLPVKVRVVAKDASPAKPIEPALFEKFDASKWGSGAGSTPVTTTPPAVRPATGAKPTAESTVAAKPALAADPPKSLPAGVSATFFGYSLGSGVVLLFIFAAIGGFVLNLTPCVLPVIPIKILTLTQHAGSHGRAIVLGAWMAFGVIAFWTAIGIPMAFVSASLDPSQFIFGRWYITLGLGVIIAVMGLGIMGMFVINLPQAVYAINPKASSPWGSFVFGIMTAVLGLPCFGFVAGGLLAGAATLPGFTIIAIFFGLGVGMASPYLVLSAKPELLKFIPRTGPASDLVKQVMGLLLIAAAAFFASAGIKTMLSDMPYLAGSIAWWAVAFFILLASLWMVVRSYQISSKFFARAITPILALVMVGGIVTFAYGLTTSARDDWMRRMALAERQAKAPTGEIATGVWLNYTPEMFSVARASGKAVFLDFTADWCINCKAYKGQILDKDPVRSRMERSDLVIFEVDCSSTASPGWKLLKELERTGIPTWVVYGPGASSKPIVVDLSTPTPDATLSALDRAGVQLKAEVPASKSQSTSRSN